MMRKDNLANEKKGSFQAVNKPTISMKGKLLFSSQAEDEGAEEIVSSVLSL